jgi:hypothetical protein
MATISISAAQGFSNPAILDRLQPIHLPADQLREVLPVWGVSGWKVRLNAAEASDLASYATTVGATGVAVSTSLPAFSVLEGKMAHLAAILEADSVLGDQYGSRSRLLRHLVKLKTLAVLSRWQKLLVTGDSANAGEFDGLKKLADASSSFLEAGTYGGVPNKVNPGEMERCVAMLSSRGNLDNRYFVMNVAAFGHLAQNYYAGQIRMQDHPLFGSLPHISGVPILLDNWIPTNEGVGGNETRIFAVLIGPPAGLVGLVPKARVGREVQVRPPSVVEGTDRQVFKVSFVGGLLAMDPNAVACISKVIPSS